MKCDICDTEARHLFSGLILQKYKCDYFFCSNCGCLFTETPYWSKEAYARAIAITDTGVLQRNERLCSDLMRLLKSVYPSAPTILDYGAGYGIMVRMLRDRGVNAFWRDLYCENIFANGFEYSSEIKPDIVIAFEVLEHIYRQKPFFEEVFAITDTLIATTELIPSRSPESIDQKWWYLSPETGQHVFFFSERSFHMLADAFSAEYFHIGQFHIITKDTRLLSELRRNNKPSPIRAALSRILRRIAAVSARSKNRKNTTDYGSLTWNDHLLMVDTILREGKK